MIRIVNEDTILLFADMNLAEMFGVIAFVFMIGLLIAQILRPNKNHNNQEK
jgi:hypothetical protein